MTLTRTPCFALLTTCTASPNKTRVFEAFARFSLGSFVKWEHFILFMCIHSFLTNIFSYVNTAERAVSNWNVTPDLSGLVYIMQNERLIGANTKFLRQRELSFDRRVSGEYVYTGNPIGVRVCDSWSEISVRSSHIFEQVKRPIDLQTSSPDLRWRFIFTFHHWCTDNRL